MGTKLFQLIHSGETVKLATCKRIIPAEAFSELLSLEDLRNKMEEDGKLYREEALRACEALKEAAKKEGYEAGFAEWAKHVAALEKQRDEVRGEINKVVGPLALQAAKKIVGREMDVSPDAVVDIIKSSLKSVAQHKQILIYVNPKELETIEGKKESIKEVFEKLESLSIRPREDIKPGGCVIETEQGIINAQLENKWEALERAFLSMGAGKKL
jgi:type III secretion protein L